MAALVPFGIAETWRFVVWLGLVSCWCQGAGFDLKINSRFEQKANRAVTSVLSDISVPFLRFTVPEGRSAFPKVNPREVAGLDEVTRRVLGNCEDQRARMFMNIFNLSLFRSEIATTCFTKTAIIAVPKKSKISCLNDYHPVALTSIIMKCFERLEVH